MSQPALSKPEDLHPALAAAFNADDLDAMTRLYDPKAVFVTKPGHVTDGPAELRAALAKMIGVHGTLAIAPRSFTRSGDVVLALGTFSLSGGKRSDGTPVEIVGRFADVLRLQPDGRWLLAVDNGFAGE